MRPKKPMAEKIYCQSLIVMLRNYPYFMEDQHTELTFSEKQSFLI